MLVSYLLLAVAAGYSSVWLWGMVNHSFEGWQKVAWRCAAYFPGITLLIMSLLNFLIVQTGSSGAIPLGAFFSLLALWFLISIPLCFSGMKILPACRCLQCMHNPLLVIEVRGVRALTAHPSGILKHQAYELLPKGWRVARYWAENDDIWAHIEPPLLTLQMVQAFGCSPTGGMNAIAKHC